MASHIVFPTSQGVSITTSLRVGKWRDHEGHSLTLALDLITP